MTPGMSFYYGPGPGSTLQVRAGTVSRNTEHMTRRVGALGIFYMV